jgi:hypothetical protein
MAPGAQLWSLYPEHLRSWIVNVVHAVAIGAYRYVWILFLKQRGTMYAILISIKDLRVALPTRF